MPGTKGTIPDPVNVLDIIDFGGTTGDSTTTIIHSS